MQVIRLALERLQIFKDKTLYELHEGCLGDEDNWTLLKEGETKITTRARAPQTSYYSLSTSSSIKVQTLGELRMRGAAYPRSPASSSRRV